MQTLDEQLASNTQLAAALVKFQATNQGLALDKAGQRSSYASIGSLMTQMKRAAAEHGLAFSAPVDYAEDCGWHLRTTLLHISGESITGRYPVSVDDITNSQKIGSAISYARRYGMMAVLGLAAGIAEDDFDEDDDGQINGELRDPPKPPTDQWTAWGDAAIAEIGAMTSLEALSAWDTANSDNIDNCALVAPEVYQKVGGNFANKQTQLQGA